MIASVALIYAIGTFGWPVSALWALILTGWVDINGIRALFCKNGGNLE